MHSVMHPDSSANPQILQAILAVAYRHRIVEPNIEAGFERFAVLTDTMGEYGEFCDAIAQALRQGLICEPIRLPEGALQCHWHLQLTATGVTVARAGSEA